MKINFDKMEGAGNDFIFIDNRAQTVPAPRKSELARKCCRRRFGVGADGMMFIEPDPEFDFAWDFYNADGSVGGMCGNGARCAVRYAAKLGIGGKNMTFRTLAGPIRGELTARGAKVQLTDVPHIGAEESVPVGGEQVKLWFLNTGVPHAVVLAADLEATDAAGVGRALRNHPRFAPAGTNVNFIAPGTGDSLSIRTYERGVEDETLACGTGTVAASIVAAKYLGRKSPIVATTRGGEELAVYFTLERDGAKNVFLEGGARLVFSGAFEFSG